MSASIHYRMVKDTPDPTVKVFAPSGFIEAMAAAFGGATWQLDSSSLPILRGMAAASKEPAYQHLIDLIDQFEVIEVYYQY